MRQKRQLVALLTHHTSSNRKAGAKRVRYLREGIFLVLTIANNVGGRRPQLSTGRAARK